MSIWSRTDWNMNAIHSKLWPIVGIILTLCTVSVHSSNGTIFIRRFQRLEVGGINPGDGMGLKVLGLTLCEITMNDCAWMCVIALPGSICMAYTITEDYVCYLYEFCRDSILPPRPPGKNSFFGEVGQYLIHVDIIEFDKSIVSGCRGVARISGGGGQSRLSEIGWPSFELNAYSLQILNI